MDRSAQTSAQTSAEAQCDEVFEFEHVGAELRNPEVRTPANHTSLVTVWNPYYGIRASKRARLLMSLVLVGPVVLLFGGGLLLVVFQIGPMFGILLMMFAVPAMPIAALDLRRPLVTSALIRALSA